MIILFVLEFLLSKSDEWKNGHIVCDAYGRHKPESGRKVFDIAKADDFTGLT